MAHVEKRGPRKYRARYRGPDGKERSRTFERERDATNWLATVTTSQLKAEWVDPRLGKITLRAWADEWRRTVTGIRPSTWARDEMYLDNRVLARFGAYPLSGIRHVDVRAWVALLETEGYAAATVQKCVQILAKVLRAAVEAGMLTSNPCDRVPLPRIEREEMRFCSPTELDALASSIDQRYRALMFVGGYCGLRAGEMFGLRRGRIDFLRRRIDVAEIAVEIKGKHFYGPPKTRAGRRSVPMPRVVAHELEVVAKGLEPGALVFTSPEGGTIRASLFRRRFWQPACVKAGVGQMVKGEHEREHYEGLRLHDLRHTAVALWIAAGASPKEIAARAGHTSVAVVLDRYGHLLPGSEDRVNEALDAMADLSRPDRGLGVVASIGDNNAHQV